MNTNVQEAVVNELRNCIRTGRGLPRCRPDPGDLFDACGGDGHLALLVMLEYLEAERLVKDETRAAANRRMLERRAA